MALLLQAGRQAGAYAISKTRHVEIFNKSVFRARRKRNQWAGLDTGLPRSPMPSSNPKTTVAFGNWERERAGAGKLRNLISLLPSSMPTKVPVRMLYNRWSDYRGSALSIIAKYRFEGHLRLNESLIIQVGRLTKEHFQDRKPNLVSEGTPRACLPATG